MTFDLTDEQARRLAAVREVATTLGAPAAAAIDSTGRIPDEVRRAVSALAVWAHGDLEAALAIEELASASASVAAVVALNQMEAVDEGLAGLRGVAPVADPTSRQQLALAAVCLGIGRAALHEALRAIRVRGDRPAGEPSDAPHWVLADAATEMDAARLLTHAAAQGSGDPAHAFVLAASAATRAVDAALRMIGTEAFRPGTVLERCSRDIRAASLVIGTEDAARRRAGVHG